MKKFSNSKLKIKQTETLYIQSHNHYKSGHNTVAKMEQSRKQTINAS